MSAKATAWAWNARVAALPKLVLLAIADRHHPDSFVVAEMHGSSFGVIAEQCGVDIGELHDSISVLVARGLVRPTTSPRGLLAFEIQWGAK